MRLELTGFQRREMRPDAPLPRCPAGGKVRFPSEAQVREARGHKSARLRIYRCPHCRGWHLTKGIGAFD